MGRHIEGEVVRTRERVRHVRFKSLPGEYAQYLGPSYCAGKNKKNADGIFLLCGKGRRMQIQYRKGLGRAACDTYGT